jgi:N-acetylmuramoyl-L-alanine amidase
MKVLIDNGHGENTAGKRSPDGALREYAFAREIADEVVRLLKKKGVEAEKVTPETVDVSLGERCRRVNVVCNKEGTKNVLLVSIHSNAAGNGSAWMQGRGWEAYTTVGKTKADELAECLYDAAKECFVGMKIRTDTKDGDSDKEAGLYILKNTKCPAVLTENFFHDNKEDVEYMTSAAGKAAIVKCHVDGIMKYIEMQK